MAPSRDCSISHGTTFTSDQRRSSSSHARDVGPDQAYQIRHVRRLANPPQRARRDSLQFTAEIIVSECKRNTVLKIPAQILTVILTQLPLEIGVFTAETAENVDDNLVFACAERRRKAGHHAGDSDIWLHAFDEA